MAYITRQDGERFVIPSYREVISKGKAELKGIILELSTKYGEYITLQRRGLASYEVAFSHDTGYLFGECVWYYFKRPKDMIYCEAIPDTTEAYLVIVKGGAVYLDGIFPLDDIAEELLVFTNQKNQFDIYVFGDTPIVEQPLEGKFAFDLGSVKSFNVLEASIYQQLPVVKMYQLQLVDIVLRQHGIGVFPVKYVLAVVVFLGLGWMGYTFVNIHQKTMPSMEAPPPPNPYLAYNNTLVSVAPDVEVKTVMAVLKPILTMPGWIATEVTYSKGKLTINVKSLGAKGAELYRWAEENHFNVELNPSGYILSISVPPLPKRGVPRKIYSYDRVITSLVDRLSSVLRGNVLQLSNPKTKGNYKESDLSIKFTQISPEVVIMIADQLKDLPLVLTSMSMSVGNSLTGTLNLIALGN